MRAGDPHHFSCYGELSAGYSYWMFPFGDEVGDLFSWIGTPWLASYAVFV
jgi:hypothetical protein